MSNTPPPPVERLSISNFQGYKSGSPIEVRSSQSRSIGGYAAVFERSSENLGGFYERVHPQAFNKSKADGWPNVVCRWNHRDDFLLGTTRSGTLQLNIDHNGLDYQVDLPDCRSDVLEMAARGDLVHSSFAFQTWDEDWLKGDSGYPVRMLLSCRLIDTAPVTSPAYPDATCALRSFARFVDAPYEDVVDRAAKDELRGFWTRTDHSGRPAPKSGAKQSSKDVDAKARSRRGRLELAKSEGEVIDAQIVLNHAKSRNQKLRKQLDNADAQQGAAERQAQLDYQWRMGQLTDAKIRWA
ncbi:HK97 family phage prohead protease [Mycobacterium colombiense]